MNNMDHMTIAAIATGLSNSGIGIIRISGSESIDILNRIFCNKYYKHIAETYQTHTIHYGFIIDSNNEKIDEVMISIMKAPNSYTKEDVVEVSCHGGIFVVKKILYRIFEAGARLAQPGEFTKRAFLNGRIDLTEAEAVMDIIHAENEFALKSSLQQLNGELAKKITELRNQLLYEIAFIESALDDPEHISLDGYPEKLRINVESVTTQIKQLFINSDNGKILKDGINTVIIGKPNAGKSSLLNLLAGDEKAIVTDIAGTTRDAIEEHIMLGTISLNIIDTAGIRNTEDTIEKIGVKKAIEYAKDADLIIYVVDSSVSLDDNDYKIIDLLHEKNCIVLLNKSDLEQIVTEEQIQSLIEREVNIVKTSILENNGIDKLQKMIEEMFINGTIEQKNEIFITNLRQKENLQIAYDSLQLVLRSIEEQMPEDFFSIDLMNAYQSLGFIIGEDIDDDLMNEIFSKFCTGK